MEPMTLISPAPKVRSSHTCPLGALQEAGEMGLTSLDLVWHFRQHEEGLPSSTAPRERRGTVKPHEGTRETGSHRSPPGSWLTGITRALLCWIQQLSWILFKCFASGGSASLYPLTFYQHPSLFSHFRASAYLGTVASNSPSGP